MLTHQTYENAINQLVFISKTHYLRLSFSVLKNAVPKNQLSALNVMASHSTKKLVNLFSRAGESSI